MVKSFFGKVVKLFVASGIVRDTRGNSYGNLFWENGSCSRSIHFAIEKFSANDIFDGLLDHGAPHHMSGVKSSNPGKRADSRP